MRLMTMNTSANFFLRTICILCVVMCICLPCASSSQGVPDWWESDTLIATGYGAAQNKIDSVRHNRVLAKRAAVMDAYRKLAEQAKTIRITAEKTIGSQIEAGEISSSKIDAVIKGATVLREEYDEYNNCTVVMSVPIYGVTDSIALAALKPAVKKDFPPPSTSDTAQGNYTGLIIDCGDLELTPVLTPVIRDANDQSLYSFEHLDYDKVITKGMVSYVTRSSQISAPQNFMLVSTRNLPTISIAAQKNLSRAGDNPLIIKAQRMSDDNSCPVISAEDADKILIENGASHFLDNGAVVFTSYRVGGLRA